MTSATTTYKKPSILPATMFIAGNSIGSGILALPIMLGLAGFYPSVIGLIVLWATMFTSGMAIVTSCVKHSLTGDLPSLYEKIFGKTGKYIVTIGYLFLFYGLSVAFLSGSAGALISLLPLPYIPVICVIFLTFALFVLKGINLVYKSNNILMFILLLSFALMIGLAFTKFDIMKLSYVDLAFLPAALPSVLCSFGFHNTLPIVCKSLGHNKKMIRSALLIGSLLPLLLNVIILIAAAGSIPILGGEASLFSAFKNQLPATIPLSLILKSPIFTTLGLIFTLMAIFTSYLGVNATLISFIRDLMPNVKKYKTIKEFALTFGLPFIITLFARNIFLQAISVAVGMGATVIFGIMPCLMAYKQSSLTAKVIAITSLPIFSAIFLLEFLQVTGVLKIVPSLTGSI